MYESISKPVFDKQMNIGQEMENLTKQRDELLPLLMNGQVSVNYHLAVLEVGLLSAKSYIFSVKFHPRLAVSKWIAPRSFLMGGELGYNIRDDSNIIILFFISAS